MSTNKEGGEKKKRGEGEKKTQVSFHTIDKAYNPEKSAVRAKARQHSV